MSNAQTKFDPKIETYLEIENMIRKIVNQFCRNKTGIDQEEAYQTAVMLYWCAEKDFDPEKSNNYVSYVWNRIQHGLIDWFRKEIRKRKTPIVDFTEKVVPTIDREFSIVEWLNSLNDDGKFVVGLVLDPPEQIKKEIAVFGDKPIQYRMSVKKYLSDNNWTKERIKNAFENVKRSLE